MDSTCSNYEVNKSWCSITGVKFWKVGSRKLFAIVGNKKGKGKGKGKYKRDSDDFSDAEPGHAKKKARLYDQVHAIELKVVKMLEVPPRFSFPANITSIIEDTFRCSICRISPIVPPVIYTRCCKQLVGCQSCVDEWYRDDHSMEKICPLCRESNGLGNTMVVLGMDGFLTMLDQISNCVPPPPKEPIELPSDSDLSDF